MRPGRGGDARLRGRQALPVLARLQRGDTHAQRAAGFTIGIATAYQYIREAVEVPAALAPPLTEVTETARRKRP